MAFSSDFPNQEAKERAEFHALASVNLRSSSSSLTDWLQTQSGVEGSVVHRRAGWGVCSWYLFGYIITNWIGPLGSPRPVRPTLLGFCGDGMSA